MSFAQRILAFNAALDLEAQLPKGIRVMNPFRDQGQERVNSYCEAFYHKFYNDEAPRKLMVGINPGRHGAGLTGIPFTDTKRLEQFCEIPSGGLHSHEPSSVFIYELIEAYGGVDRFYNRFFINSVCPLGFVISNDKDREVNYNYYDAPDLQKAVLPFILQSLKQMIGMGMDTEKVYCLGTGKNFKFLKELNKAYTLFGSVVALEHPRYVMQYKSKQKQEYLDKFVALLAE